jgi:prophage regulatory protein
MPLMSSQNVTELDGLLNRAAVIATTGLSRATIDRMRKSGEFPEPIKLSARRVAWTRASVSEWIASRQRVGG